MKCTAADLFCGSISMKTSNLGHCLVCGKSLEGKRPEAKYCSEHCYNIRKRKTPIVDRQCPVCEEWFQVTPEARNGNQKYCSRQCARRATEKKLREWKDNHPGYMKPYNNNRLFKSPGAWKEKYRNERTKALKLLGGKCCIWS